MIIARGILKIFKMSSLPVSKNASQNSTFRKQILVRFGDCDAAGIVFYPRYFDMFNSLVEDWCREELNFPFSEIVMHRGLGLPTVHLEVDFWRQVLLAMCCPRCFQ